MPTFVALSLRTVEHRGDEVIYPCPDRVDLDRLSPRARALAEAVAASPGCQAGEIWVECDLPVRDTQPDWEVWYGPDGGDRHERRPWTGWDAKFPATREVDPHWWLERQAARIPAGWHVIGAHPRDPVPTQDRRLTVDQVVATAARRGVFMKPGTWRAYVARKQAPAPDGYVGSTPVWEPMVVMEWLAGRPGQGARTDLG